jgi:nucleotidyltransferase substrate binding protein (TIGR01987 family)
MAISIDPLKKAFASFIKAMERSLKDPSDLEIRDACIQRFEYTYELCIKTIKRYIEQEMPSSENIDQLNYRDLLRVAFEAGLIDHIDCWFQYREARNQTSHAYDEIKAQAVYEVFPDFTEKARFFLKQLEEKLVLS